MSHLPEKDIPFFWIDHDMLFPSPSPHNVGFLGEQTVVLIEAWD